MGPFEVAALAIVVWGITEIISKRAKLQKGVGHAKIQELERRVRELEAHQNVKALEERVHSLENIVTTDEFELKEKFKHLEE